MPLQIPRVTIGNWTNWGNLVKSWASGENRVGKQFTGMPPGAAPPIPQSRDELIQQCKDADVGMVIPDRVKAVQFIQANEETLLIRLPAKPMLLDSEQAIRANIQDYPLPSFYHEFWATGPSLLPPTLTPDNVMTFHADRIGDYTISQCA